MLVRFDWLRIVVLFIKYYILSILNQFLLPRLRNAECLLGCRRLFCHAGSFIPTHIYIKFYSCLIGAVLITCFCNTVNKNGIKMLIGIEALQLRNIVPWWDRSIICNFSIWFKLVCVLLFGLSLIYSPHYCWVLIITLRALVFLCFIWASRQPFSLFPVMNDYWIQSLSFSKCFSSYFVLLSVLPGTFSFPREMRLHFICY